MRTEGQVRRCWSTGFAPIIVALALIAILIGCDGAPRGDIAVAGLTMDGTPHMDTSEWRSLAESSYPRGLCAAGVIDGRLYVAGGSGAVGGFEYIIYDLLERYDPESDAWTTLEPMPVPRSAHAGAVAGGKLYVVGGYGPEASVYSYSPATDSWTKHADLPTPRHSLAAAAVDGKLYAVGGFDDENIVGTLECYDLETDTWSRLADMPTPRIYPSAVAHGGKLYVIGGECNGYQSVVECYDPATDLWSRRSNMPAPRTECAVAATGNGIFVAGGYFQESTFEESGFNDPITEEEYRPLHDMQFYAPETDTWSACRPMPTSRTGPVAGTIDGMVYVFGGLGRHYEGSSPSGGFVGVLERFDPRASSDR